MVLEVRSVKFKCFMPLSYMQLNATRNSSRDEKENERIYWKSSRERELFRVHSSWESNESQRRDVGWLLECAALDCSKVD